MLAVVDTETGRQRYVQTSSAELRLRYQAAANLRHRGIARAIAGAGAEHLHLSTSGDWLTDTWHSWPAARTAAGQLPAVAHAPETCPLLRLTLGNLTMTFLSAWRLVLLVAPLALLVAYVLVQRRRHAQVLRFTSVDLLDSVAPKRSAWRRHVPAVATLLSLVVLTLAFAQPAMTMKTAKERATIILTLDTSGSMSAADVSPKRLEAMEEQATTSSRTCPSAPDRARHVQPSASAGPAEHRHAPVLAALDTLTVGGGTATADGITTALQRSRVCPRGRPASRRRRSS